MDLGNLFRENFEEELMCRFIVRGKNKERYILCKTESGIRLIPYTVSKDLVFSADCENAVFLPEEDIKKASVLKADRVYKIRIRLKDGTKYRLTTSLKTRIDPQHKENVKTFKNLNKKASMGARVWDTVWSVAAVIIALTMIFHIYVYFAPYEKVDGNELIAYYQSEGQDFMFESPVTYDKADLKLSGETHIYENNLYSAALPMGYKINEGMEENEFSDNYISADGRTKIIFDKEELSLNEDDIKIPFSERAKEYIFKVSTYGKCKKYFGIKPDSRYNYEKISKSINLNDLDVNDNDMCYVYYVFSLMKSISSSPLTGGGKYIVENDDYCGFVTEARLNDNKNCILSFYFYSADDLNTPYQISFIINDCTEEDIETAYAILNSLEMK